MPMHRPYDRGLLTHRLYYQVIIPIVFVCCGQVRNLDWAVLALVTVIDFLLG